MHDITIIKANDKVASFRFMPGWGEPGEWMVTLDKQSIMLDDVSGMGANQLEYLKMFSADVYILKLASSNWEGIGIRDDAIRLCLEYTGYGEAQRAHDMGIIEKLTSIATDNEHSIYDLIDGANTADMVSLRNLDIVSNQYRKELEQEISRRRQIVTVYDRLKNGEQVGVGWSNETLFRDYPDSREAKLVKAALDELES